MEPVLKEAEEVVARGKVNIVQAIRSQNDRAREGNKPSEEVNLYFNYLGIP